jgi:hypothetical protein
MFKQLHLPTMPEGSILCGSGTNLDKISPPAAASALRSFLFKLYRYFRIKLTVFPEFLISMFLKT